MGVDHGRGQIAVSEQLLNGADVGAALEQVGGEGMAKGMCADVLRKPGTANGHFDGFVDDAGINVMVAGATFACTARSVRNDSILASAGKRASRDRMLWKRTNRTIQST